MSVDVLHCPCCHCALLRSDAEGLFHSSAPSACGVCGRIDPLSGVVVEVVCFKPTPWPPLGAIFADRRAADN